VQLSRANIAALVILLTALYGLICLGNWPKCVLLFVTISLHSIRRWDLRQPQVEGAFEGGVALGSDFTRGGDMKCLNPGQWRVEVSLGERDPQL